MILTADFRDQRNSGCSRAGIILKVRFCILSSKMLSKQKKRDPCLGLLLCMANHFNSHGETWQSCREVGRKAVLSQSSCFTPGG